jgi:hypothetical protein
MAINGGLHNGEEMRREKEEVAATVTGARERMGRGLARPGAWCGFGRWQDVGTRLGTAAARPEVEEGAPASGPHAP